MSSYGEKNSTWNGNSVRNTWTVRRPCAAGCKPLNRSSDHLPLALGLVTSYLHETRRSPAEWLEEWRQRPSPTLKFYNAGA